MEEGATVALVAVAAIALVFFVNARQEAQTNMVIAQIRAQQQQQQQSGSRDSGALSLQDAIAVVGTAAATYFGGPGAGAKAASALAPR